MKEFYTAREVLPDGTVVDVHFDTSKPWTGHVLATTVAVNPNQPRTWFEPEAQQDLAGSIDEVGQATPITAILYKDPARPDILWMVNDGERRVRSLQEKGERIWLTYDPKVTSENLSVMSFVANFCRLGHTNGEAARAIDGLLVQGRSYAQIGKLIGYCEQWVKQKHALIRLHPALIALLDPPTPKKGRLPLSSALQLVNIDDKDEQMKIWEQVKGLKRGKLAVAIRALDRRAAAGATSKRGRRRSDDTKYIRDKVHGVGRRVAEMLDFPVVVFEAFRRGDIDTLQAEIAQYKEQLDGFLEKLKEHARAVETPLPKPQAAKKEERIVPEKVQVPAARPRPIPPQRAERPERPRKTSAAKTVGSDRLAHSRPMPLSPDELRRASAAASADAHYPDKPDVIALESSELPKPIGDIDVTEFLRGLRESHEIEDIPSPQSRKKDAFVPVSESPVLDRHKSSDEIIRELRDKDAKLVTIDQGRKLKAEAPAEPLGTGFKDSDFRDDES